MTTDKVHENSATTRVEKPYAFCCAEGGGNVEHCDCVKKDHGTAWLDLWNENKAIAPE